MTRRKSAFDFEGGAEYGEFFDLGVDLAQDGSSQAEKNAAFNTLWGMKYRGTRDWEGKKYTEKDKAKARKALNAGWGEQRSGALAEAEEAAGSVSWGPLAVLLLGGAVVVWFVMRQTTKTTTT